MLSKYVRFRIMMRKFGWKYYIQSINKEFDIKVNPVDGRNYNLVEDVDHPSVYRHYHGNVVRPTLFDLPALVFCTHEERRWATLIYGPSGTLLGLTIGITSFEYVCTYKGVTYYQDTHYQQLRTLDVGDEVVYSTTQEKKRNKKRA